MWPKDQSSLMTRFKKNFGNEPTTYNGFALTNQPNWAVSSVHADSEGRWWLVRESYTIVLVDANLPQPATIGDALVHVKRVIVWVVSSDCRVALFLPRKFTRVKATSTTADLAVPKVCST